MVFNEIFTKTEFLDSIGETSCAFLLEIASGSYQQ